MESKIQYGLITWNEASMGRPLSNVWTTSNGERAGVHMSRGSRILPHLRPKHLFWVKLFMYLFFTSIKKENKISSLLFYSLSLYYTLLKKEHKVSSFTNFSPAFIQPRTRHWFSLVFIPFYFSPNQYLITQ